MHVLVMPAVVVAAVLLVVLVLEMGVAGAVFAVLNFLLVARRYGQIRTPYRPLYSVQNIIPLRSRYSPH